MTNISDGGCGYVGKRSDATRKRMSGPKSKEHTEKLRANMRSRFAAGTEARKKMAVTQMGNTRGRGEKNGEAVLTEADVIKIRQKLQEGQSLTVLARAYGVSKAAMSKIRTGRTWKYLGPISL